jgi:hypothetical protein
VLSLSKRAGKTKEVYMKKLFILLAACIAIVGMTGCTQVSKGFFGNLSKVVLPDDYEVAGQMTGEAAYMAYVIMKGDPKYDKYTAKMEEIYKALEAGEKESLVMGDLNNTFLEVMRVAMTAKYGYVKGALVTDGIRIGGVIADRIVSGKVDTVKAEQYLNGVKKGVDNAIATTPADAFTEFQKPTEEDKRIIRCPDGNCKGDLSGNKKVSYQAQVAKELLDSGWVDPNGEPLEEGGHNIYQNLQDFVERCKILKKFGVKKTVLYLGKYEIKDNKLVDLEFWFQEENGELYKVTCVSCMNIPELADIADAEW